MYVETHPTALEALDYRNAVSDTNYRICVVVFNIWSYVGYGEFVYASGVFPVATVRNQAIL